MFLLIDNREGSDGFEDLGNPVSSEDNEEANDALGEAFFTFFNFFWVVSSGKDGEAREDDDSKKD